MDDDQQFCLRWNNHQSTLISVFDTLLENETLVDCTLAAEGKFLKAHKVVLSACSPYFATLLQEQYDKHPIFILKDVKYQELRAMMDYMYRGEVNISQDQLAALLKAAESLQIKGLSDNRTTTGNANTAPKLDTSHQQQQQQQHRNLNVPVGGGAGGGGVSGKIGSGYTLEQTKRARLGPNPMDAQEMSGSREGSSSPSRRRRKVRRRSIENALADVHHENSNSSANQTAIQQQSNTVVGASGLSGVSAITAAASALAAAQLPTGALAAAAAAAAVGASPTVGSSTSSSSAANVAPGTTTAAQQMTTSVTKKTDSVKGATSDAMNTENISAAGTAGVSADDQESQPQQPHTKVEKQNHKQKIAASAGGKDTSDMVIEPKSEYDDDGNEGTVEDLTLDDEEMGMDDLDHNAGTSQAGEGSSQGYVPWQHERSQDELLMATQEAQQRDPQDLRTTSLYNFTATDAATAAEKAFSSTNLLNNTCATATVTTTSIKGASRATAGTDVEINNITELDLNEFYEPEISLRAATSNHNCFHKHNNNKCNNNNNNNSDNNNDSNKSNNNCSGCQITAAAASFQLANLIGNSMLLPHVVAENVAAKAAAAAQLVVFNTKSSQSKNHCNLNNNINNNNNSTTIVTGGNNHIAITATMPKKASVHFHCEFCAFSCSWKYDLKLHLRQKHGIHNKKI